MSRNKVDAFSTAPKPMLKYYTVSVNKTINKIDDV